MTNIKYGIHFEDNADLYLSVDMHADGTATMCLAEYVNKSIDVEFPLYDSEAQAIRKLYDATLGKEQVQNDQKQKKKPEIERD